MNVCIPMIIAWIYTHGAHITNSIIGRKEMLVSVVIILEITCTDCINVQ